MVLRMGLQLLGLGVGLGLLGSFAVTRVIASQYGAFRRAIR
jgi:hypothetical protein